MESQPTDGTQSEQKESWKPNRADRRAWLKIQFKENKKLIKKAVNERKKANKNRETKEGEMFPPLANAK